MSAYTERSSGSWSTARRRAAMASAGAAGAAVRVPEPDLGQFGGLARAPRPAQSTARPASPTRRASAEPAPSSIACSGCAATACRTTVRYGSSASRSCSGAGSPMAVQSCMTIRASRPGSIRTPSAGSLTQGTPAQSTPGVCPDAAASSGRPSSGRPAAASRCARATTVPTKACCSSGKSSRAPSARAASRLSSSWASGRVGAWAMRAGEVVGGVPHLAPIEGVAGLFEVLVGGPAWVVHTCANLSFPDVLRRRARPSCTHGRGDFRRPRA